MWRDADPNEVQALWAAELFSFDAEDIRTALAQIGDHHPEYPPTLYEFRNLCRDAKRRRQNYLASLPNKVKEPIPPRVQAMLAEFKAKHVVTK